jgi:hypothetical protein
MSDLIYPFVVEIMQEGHHEEEDNKRDEANSSAGERKNGRRQVTR